MCIQRILEEHDPKETQERLQLFNDKLLQIGEGFVEFWGLQPLIPLLQYVNRFILRFFL